MALNVRLNARTERMLDRLASRRGQSRSDVVREAIEHYGAAYGEDTAGQGPFAAWADAIGVVDLGARDPERTTGEQFADRLREATRARRSR